MNRAELQGQTRKQLLALVKKADIQQGRHRMSKDQLIGVLLSLGSPAPPGTGVAVESVEKPLEAGAATAAPAIAVPAGITPTEIAGSAKVASAPTPIVTPIVATPVADEATPLPEALTALPASYWHPRLTLLEVGPGRVHAYWEVAPKDRDAAMERLGPEGQSAVWVLRFYDVTCVNFDGTNAHSCFDVPIDLIASNWYVDRWSSQRSYCADIGPYVPNGRFAPVCRSNFVHLPRVDPAPLHQPDWLRVDGTFENVERVPEPPPEEPPLQPVSAASQAPGADSAEQCPAPAQSVASIPPPIEQPRGEEHVVLGEPHGAAPVCEPCWEQAVTELPQINETDSGQRCAEQLARPAPTASQPEKAAREDAHAPLPGTAPVHIHVVEGRWTSPSWEKSVSSLGSGGSLDSAKEHQS